MAADFALVLAVNAGAVFAIMLALWRLSVALADASIVDIFWGPGFAVIAWIAWLIAGAPGPRSWLVLGLTTLWAARLGLYLLWRKWGEGEDPRYAALRARAGAAADRTMLTRVFLTQGAVMWVVSLPVQFAVLYREPAALGWPAAFGIGVVAVGLVFETVGDAQLARFKADPANRGRILDRGLWRYTRHPNYFGDAGVWWGFFLIACDHPIGLLTVASPVAMTWFLVRVTGKALLEKRMRRANPAYADYSRRTSGFVPWPPRKS
jgi:steroid 5-alpha reductase family enzyme